MEDTTTPVTPTEEEVVASGTPSTEDKPVEQGTPEETPAV
jgi:hypothetical protein